jgi:hypothetical protein
MCMSLTLKMFGASLFVQGCIGSEPASLRGIAEPSAPAVTSEDWAPLVAKGDPEEDGSITYLFRDPAGRVRPAVATCGDTMPNEREGNVRIVQTRMKSLTVYSVGCTEPPKMM